MRCDGMDDFGVLDAVGSLSRGLREGRAELRHAERRIRVRGVLPGVEPGGLWVKPDLEKLLQPRINVLRDSTGTP